MRSPVCRGGYRGHSPDIVGRVRNTRPAPARPPRRSIVLRPLSGCNRLNESVKEEQKKKKSTFQCVFLFAVPERSSLNAKCLQKYSNNGVFTLWKHNPANTTWRFLTNYTWLVKDGWIPLSSVVLFLIMTVRGRQIIFKRKVEDVIRSFLPFLLARLRQRWWLKA